MYIYNIYYTLKNKIINSLIFSNFIRNISIRIKFVPDF